MQELIYIGGVLMPAPRTYTVSLQDLDSSDSGRSETGVMVRNRVRAGVYKIQATWRVTRTDLAKIVAAINAVSFSVRFFDPNTLTTPTKTMYAGDRSANMVQNSDAPNETWWDFSVNFIEY